LAAIYSLPGREKLSPRFFTANVVVDQMFPIKGEITKAEGNVLAEVNGKPTMQFLKEASIISGDDALLIGALPLVVFAEDGSQIIRNCIEAAPDGSLILAGAIPSKGRLGAAVASAKSVLATSDDVLSEVRREADGKVVLIYSCVGRHWLLAGQETAEEEIAEKVFGGGAVYSMAYSGGELFPTQADKGTTNRLQNESLVVCVL